MSTENGETNASARDDEWTVVKRKPRKSAADKPKLNTAKYVRKYWSGITKKDCTLTKQEEAIIAQAHADHPMLDYGCACCRPDLVSDIIRRSYFGCQQCFCCDDDPEWNHDKIQEAFDYNQPIGEGWFYEYNPNYCWTQDHMPRSEKRKGGGGNADEEKP